MLYNYNFTAPANVGDAYGQAEQFSNKNTAFSSVNIQEGIFWYYDRNDNAPTSSTTSQTEV